MKFAFYLTVSANFFLAFLKESRSTTMEIRSMNFILSLLFLGRMSTFSFSTQGKNLNPSLIIRHWTGWKILYSLSIVKLLARHKHYSSSCIDKEFSFTSITLIHIPYTIIGHLKHFIYNPHEH